MYNPQTQTFDDPKGFVKAVRQEFPDVKVSPPSIGQAEAYDVCEGGALLLYSVRHGLVQTDDLMQAINIGADDETDAFDERPDDEGTIDVEWRFPVPQILEVVLKALNPRLDEKRAERFGVRIIKANDAGKFDKAEALIEQALMFPDA